MRKFMLVFALACPLASVGQSTITVSPQQCVWRAGDNPAWAAPDLDESGWQPNPHWQRFSPAAHIWMRCHTNLSSLKNEKQPAIQITLYGAYQLFVNGELIGGAGNLSSGVFSLNVIRQYSLPPTALDNAPETIALRVTYRVFGQMPVTAALNMEPPTIYAGDLGALDAQRAKVILADGSALLPSTALEAMIGVLGLTLLGLFYYDRGRLDLLYLSIMCIATGALRVNSFCMGIQMDYSSSLRFAIVQAGNVIAAPVLLLFFFALAGRRVPVLYWAPLMGILVQYSSSLAIVFISPDQGLSLFRWNRDVAQISVNSICWLAVSTAPFVAFWPYSGITYRLRPLAALCLVLGAANFAWFAVQITNIPQLGLPNLFSAWQLQLINIRGVVTACVLIALLVLIFRDQRMVTEERATLAGEMQAAQDIQQALVPASLETLPGFQIAVAFRPVSEVGGDFYGCRILSENRLRILLGDVSGKGAAAAMTAAVLIGAAQERQNESPAELLKLLNLVMAGMKITGFATCVCAEISADGKLTIANAGHLAPYCRGEEMALDSGLPLGSSRSETYTENTFQLSPGDALTFLSDGVVEAHSSGELFGFDRTRLISGQSAEQIAEAAQSFGQEDDITVLTLTFAPAEVAHA
jgi:sigma-B regulation protein RsbU (phosphoserine phosphatase)